MESKDAVQYLANVIAVANADKTRSPQEEEGIESIRASIGARKTDMKQAYALAEKEDFIPKPVGRYSDRVRNLEDMLFVSLLDGTISENQKTAALAFAKQIPVIQEEVQYALAKAKTRAKALLEREGIEAASGVDAKGAPRPERKPMRRIAAILIGTALCVVAFCAWVFVGKGEMTALEAYQQYRRPTNGKISAVISKEAGVEGAVIIWNCNTYKWILKEIEVNGRYRKDDHLGEYGIDQGGFARLWVDLCSDEDYSQFDPAKEPLQKVTVVVDTPMGEQRFTARSFVDGDWMKRLWIDEVSSGG